MSVEHVIREAIANRRPVALRYDDDVGLARTVLPHVLYRTSTGKICVDSYQLEGPSKSGGELPDWRPFDLSKIRDIESLDGEFDIAPGLNLSASKYSNGVLAHV